LSEITMRLRTRTLILVTVLACACTNPTGLPHSRLWFQATPSGASSASTAARSTCTELPELLGSVIDDAVSLDSGASAAISASRDAVSLRFSGTAGLEKRDITRTQLDAGYADSFQVRSGAGQAYDISLSSTCK